MQRTRPLACALTHARCPGHTSHTLVTDLVYVEVKKRAKDALLRLVEREREGELVDRALIKNILGIFIEVGMGSISASDLFRPFLLQTGWRLGPCHH